MKLWFPVMIKLKLSPKRGDKRLCPNRASRRKIREEKANVTKLSLVMLVYIFVTRKSLIV